MNIARELGSLISGLLAPQASTATRQSGKNQQDGSRTSSRNSQGLQSLPQTQGKDRITLSSASRALLEATQDPSNRMNQDTAPRSAGSAPLLALPYPSTLSESSDTAGLSSANTLPESPATRQRVRTTYGSPTTPSSDPTQVTNRIDLHA